MKQLSPLAKRVLQYIERNGSISAQEAFLYLDGTPSGSLTRRITELEENGIEIARVTKFNPVTGRRYTRYSFNEVDYGFRGDYPDDNQGSVPGSTSRYPVGASFATAGNMGFI